MQKLCFNAESAKNAKHFLCALCDTFAPFAVKKILQGANFIDEWKRKSKKRGQSFRQAKIEQTLKN
jgi:hypothetical protein